MQTYFLDSFLKTWKSTNYVGVFIIFASLYIFYLSIYKIRSKSGSILFLVYSLLILLLFLLVHYSYLLYDFSQREKSFFSETINIIFIIVELFVFITYYLHILKNRTIKIIMKLMLAVYLILFIFYLFFISSKSVEIALLSRFSFDLNILEYIFLLTTVFYYYIELLNNKPEQNLLDSPSFWITSGLFIYTIASLPFLVLAQQPIIKKTPFYYKMFTSHYIALSILLVTIIRAFLCKKPLLK